MYIGVRGGKGKRGKEGKININAMIFFLHNILCQPIGVYKV